MNLKIGDRKRNLLRFHLICITWYSACDHQLSLIFLISNIDTRICLFLCFQGLMWRQHIIEICKDLVRF